MDISSTISTDYKFTGAAVASNGKIIFASTNTDGVGVFDPTDNSFELVDISSTISTGWKFTGATTASNGKIVFTPNNAGGVGVFDPTDNSFALVDISSTVTTNAKFLGAAVASDGKIIFTPSSANGVGVFDPSRSDCLSWSGSDHSHYGSHSSLGAKKIKDGLAVDTKLKRPVALKDGLSIASHRAKVAKARAHVIAAEKLRREREGTKAAVAKHAKKVVKAEKAPLKDPNVKVQRLAKIVYAQKQKAKAAKNFMPFSSRSTTEQKLAKGAPRLAAEGALDSSAKGPQMATKKMGSAKHAAAEKGPQTAEGGALATPADLKKNKRMIIHGKDAKRPSSILRKTPKSSKRAARVRVAKRKTPVKEVLAKLAKAKAKN